MFLRLLLVTRRRRYVLTGICVCTIIFLLLLFNSASAPQNGADGMSSDVVESAAAYVNIYRKQSASDIDGEFIPRVNIYEQPSDDDDDEGDNDDDDDDDDDIIANHRPVLDIVNDVSIVDDHRDTISADNPSDDVIAADDDDVSRRVLAVPAVVERKLQSQVVLSDTAAEYPQSNLVSRLHAAESRTLTAASAYSAGRDGRLVYHSHNSSSSSPGRWNPGDVVKASSPSSAACGIFWSQSLEDMTPTGLTDRDVLRFAKSVRSQPVIHMQAPSWDRCGRPKNQYIILKDSTPLCARYRAPHHYFIQGELLSFYLARMLGITNVPSVVLSVVNSSDAQWNQSPRIREQIDEAQWNQSNVVALIQWIDQLERDKMPKLLLESLIQQNRTMSCRSEELYSLTREQLVTLLQWSDLIVFDYLTGNYDRVASMQDAADKEQKPLLMHQTIHNLLRHRARRGTSSLWLLDNESGLLDAYSLMYRGVYRKNGERFLRFHQRMLESTCIFREGTVARARHLHSMHDPARVLLDLVTSREPVFSQIPADRGMFTLMRTHFKPRLRGLLDWVDRCEAAAEIPRTS